MLARIHAHAYENALNCAYTTRAIHTPRRDAWLHMQQQYTMDLARLTVHACSHQGHCGMRRVLYQGPHTHTLQTRHIIPLCIVTPLHAHAS
jgi:hypothetical protein